MEGFYRKKGGQGSYWLKKRKGFFSRQLPKEEEQAGVIMKITSSSFGEIERAPVTDYLTGTAQKISD